MLDHLSMSLEEKEVAERRWQALAQHMGIVPYESDDAYEILLVSNSGDEIYFQTAECTSGHWEKHFFVHGPTNKKEALLAAKHYVFGSIKAMRAIRSNSTMYICQGHRITSSCQDRRIISGSDGIFLMIRQNA